MCLSMNDRPGLLSFLRADSVSCRDCSTVILTSWSAGSADCGRQGYNFRYVRADSSESIPLRHTT